MKPSRDIDMYSTRLPIGLLRSVRSSRGGDPGAVTVAGPRMVTAAAGCRPCRRAGPENSSLLGRGVRALPQGAPGPRACAGTVIYRSARTRRGAQVSATRRGKEAGPAAPADPDDARAERWPGIADFDDLVRRYRRELHVYCYRMLGSFDEAEDHVQEVFLRTWRARERFQGLSSPRTWLYRVATNACLDTLRRDARRAVPAPSSAVSASTVSASTGPSIAGMPWMQPYPDSLLDELAAGQPGPEAAAVSRETISLAFLAAIQLLPPRQRAVLVLRDVVSWPAAQVAELLDVSVAAVNSALQRARTTLREQWPQGRLDWAPATEPDPGQRRLLQHDVRLA